MAEPAFVRLAQGSAGTSLEIDEADWGDFGKPISIDCAQVPKGFDVGSPVWIWLGSDNKKGQPTSWKQGIRAMAVCSSKEKPEDGQYRVGLSDVFVLPASISKVDLLKADPEFYSDELSTTPIVGMNNNYASQVVQILTDREFWSIGQIIAEIAPETAQKLLPMVTDAVGAPAKPAKLATSSARDDDAVEPDDDFEAAVATDDDDEAKEDPIEPTDDDDDDVEEDIDPLVSEVEEDDPVLLEVMKIIEENNSGGILFVGSPGTGKSWYARHIGIRITKGLRDRFREIQFHQSYQYEDFVEGYVPQKPSGFKLEPKHLLKMAKAARKSSEDHVLVIDEFSRTDPARVLGEAMTYIDPPMRNKLFYLRSGNKARIPKNLIFFATMNPEDRSVDEIDDAMDRRWAKIKLVPDQKKVRDFLIQSGMPGPAIGPVLTFFNALQTHIVLGHAYFRSVGSQEALARVWFTQIQPLTDKRFRFDQTSRDALAALWITCRNDVAAALAPLPAADGADAPEEGDAGAGNSQA